MRKLPIALLLILLTACATAQADAPRLLVMGDSLTGGLYASDEAHAFKSVLAEMIGADLTACQGTYVHNLHNCDLGGYDYIVIEIGLNDVSNWNNGSLPESDWIAAYDALVKDARSTGAAVVITTMFHAVPFTTSDYAKYERYNGHMKAIAAANGAMLADVWTATKKCRGCLSQHWQQSEFPPAFHGDNFHPNDAGHELIARTIYEAMQHYIYLPLWHHNGYPIANEGLNE